MLLNRKMIRIVVLMAITLLILIRLGYVMVNWESKEARISFTGNLSTAKEDKK